VLCIEKRIGDCYGGKASSEYIEREFGLGGKASSEYIEREFGLGGDA